MICMSDSIIAIESKGEREIEQQFSVLPAGTPITRLY